jgi:demethylmenaquinone methyltransferase/2-methoxy-6-polyprenyl-1,4-benzoquinol methylase
MFDLIAPRYDDFTRVFSFGMDGRWKNTLVSMARDAIPRGGAVADVATGTGDLAYALSLARPDLEIAAIDASTRMLALARDRWNGQSRTGVSLGGGDISALPFAAATLHGVTAGYALRNTPDWRASINELARVMRPGGHLLTLDFYLPPSAAWRAIFLGWLSAAGRAIGWLWHREPMAYGYIARSCPLRDGWRPGEAPAIGFVCATQRRLAADRAPPSVSVRHDRRRARPRPWLRQ